MKPSFIFSSNAIRLSWKDWLVVVGILGVILLLTPGIWKHVEQFEPSADHRLPYILSNDYWMFVRWSERACAEYPAVIVGDSVVWGQYVARDQTLAHDLNARLGEERFANLGVDGTHPAAILGLLRYYGKAIANRAVILHLNPLWMSSPRHDLSGQKEFRFNHPRLVPQFLGKPACYRPTLAQRISIVRERSVPFFCWLSHIRATSFENLDLQTWTLQYPYANPLKAVVLDLPAPEDHPKSKPVSWTKKRMKQQDFPWVPTEASYQWAAFKKAVTLLQSRGNRVFVTVGPFNPYLLTEESLRRYQQMKREMLRWLEAEAIPHKALSELPSEYYADASHPLKEGYVQIADELLESEPFQKWMARISD